MNFKKLSTLIGAISNHLRHGGVFELRHPIGTHSDARTNQHTTTDFHAAAYQHTTTDRHPQYPNRGLGGWPLLVGEGCQGRHCDRT